MSRLGNLGGRLYRGEVSIDFVGRKKLWYMISGAILVISLAALLIRGLHYSIDFQGGSVFKFTTPAGVHLTQSQVANTAVSGGAPTSVIVEKVGTAGWNVQTPALGGGTQTSILDALAKEAHLPNKLVSLLSVGPSWGSQISTKALEALIAFLIVIVLYLSVAFEWRMAVAALIALAHDIVITIGVYALTGFEVSPATVIGLLTILGYSLYDTVVVFDKVRENTAGLLATRRTRYKDAANLALNQTLVRSINTSLIALLPVVSILAVSVFLLGNGELKDLSLVLFVGMLSGTYSSICIATPVLADLKERQPEFRQLAKQIAQRASSTKRQARVAVGGAPVKGAGGGVTVDEEEEDAPPEELVLDDALSDDEVSTGTVISGRVQATSQGRAPTVVRTTSGPRQQPRRTSSSQRKKRK
jgi:preprotein translocase subunit SecF